MCGFKQIDTLFYCKSYPLLKSTIEPSVGFWESAGLNGLD